MSEEMPTLPNVDCYGDEKVSPSAGLVARTLPEEEFWPEADDSEIGVSTHCTPDRRHCGTLERDEAAVGWYALRTTYGRELAASQFISEHGGLTYCPSTASMKRVAGKLRKTREPYVRNLLFAHGCIRDLKNFVYDNVNLPYLRFYYAWREVNGLLQKRPLAVPEKQLLDFRTICEADSDTLFIPQSVVQKFREGQRVRIIAGQFMGVEGRVARYKGQQRVAVIIENLLAVATAYVPTAFLERLPE